MLNFFDNGLRLQLNLGVFSDCQRFLQYLHLVERLNAIVEELHIHETFRSSQRVIVLHHCLVLTELNHRSDRVNSLM